MANHSRVKFLRSLQSRILHPISAEISVVAVRHSPSFFSKAGVACLLAWGGRHVAQGSYGDGTTICKSASWEWSPGVRRLLSARMGALLRWLHTSDFLWHWAGRTGTERNTVFPINPNQVIPRQFPSVWQLQQEELGLVIFRQG